MVARRFSFQDAVNIGDRQPQHGVVIVGISDKRSSIRGTGNRKYGRQLKPGSITDDLVSICDGERLGDDKYPAMRLAAKRRSGSIDGAVVMRMILKKCHVASGSRLG